MNALIRNRRSAGWNLIEIIVAVAIGAALAAAGVVVYQGEAQKAAVAKAKDFISQVETKKQQLVADVAAGDPNVTADIPTLASQIKVQGKNLTGVATQDATLLGFKALKYGNFDTVDTATGRVTPETQAAWVQLNNGHYIYQNGDFGTSAPY